MADTKETASNFSGGATPTVTTKKVAPTGKKKVIRRLVKNGKTGEVIKTEIVRIDSNGETTITSYPAGTPVPSLGALQASAARKPSRSSPERKDDSKEPSKPHISSGDIGPSVPVNVPGLDDLLAKEQELLKKKEKEASDKSEKTPFERKLDESLESTLISIARRKRQKDPKSRRRGLAASTMSRRAGSDDNEDKNHENENDDSEKMQTNDDEEEIKKRKERHRRRHEKRHREKPHAYRDKEANDSGIEGQNDQRPYDPEDEEQELHPLEEAELLAKQLQASASLKQQKDAEPKPIDDAAAMEVTSPVDNKPLMSDISDEDLDDKPKKKKKKHKSKKKKKKQKQKRRGSDDEFSERSDKDKRSSANEFETKPDAKPDDVVGDRKSKSRSKSRSRSHSRSKSRSRSRSSSFSSLTLSSISSDFSDSFDFAEVNPIAAMGDNAMFRGGFRGRGSFNVPFRGRAMFRGGFPRSRPPRGGFRGGWAGFPGMFPEGVDPMGNPMFMGRGGRGMWPRGPWGPMMGGRGGMNNVEEGGIGIYVEDESDKSRNRSRSYSSYSSYSSRSRSRSRRRHRRRRHSSSRSYSSYSRSSRSYSRSYSRSSRSYSRSYSRSSSRSYSSYSRSRSRSKSKRGSSSERSDHFQDIYQQGANMDQPKHDEEVPWWAEFDQTYELQKKAEQEAKALAKSQAASSTNEATVSQEADLKPGTKLQGTSYDFADMTTEDIDVVRTVMSLVDKTSHNQDPDVEDVRRCVSDLIQEVSSSPQLQTDESVAKDCLNAILNQISPDESSTVQKDSDPNLVQFPEVADDENSKLLRWYTIACHVTKQTRAMRRQAKMLTSEQEKSEDDKDSRSEGEEHQKSSDKRGRRGRRRHRRRRHRGRSYSRSSYSSSSSEKRPSLVNLTTEQQQSLQQAQQMLILQQQQLQAAGILPKSLALPLPSLIPNLLPTTSTSTTPVPEPEVLSQRWDRDMDALLKTRSKDDITRKLMERMRKKKQLGEAEESSSFLARNKAGDVLAADKIFSGSGSLKSRKIAISSIDKSKVFTDDILGYKKSDIAAAQASIEEASSKDIERLRELEQRGKLEAWSDEQKSLKEEVKRRMREEIEKAERAKKEKLKEQMLEEEKQREIMRIREEVRQQIKQEIRDEIEKQRKQVLEDPELKSQLMELEALRQSKVSKSESGIKPVEDKFVKEQDKHKQEMNSWLEKHGKQASEMGADEMRRMQMVYMQQLHSWSQQQQKAYMQWYWHQQQHFQQHTSLYNRQSTSYYDQKSASNELDSSRGRDLPNSSSSASMGVESGAGETGHDSESNPGSTFTHAPSQGPRSDDMEGTTRSIPPRGLMSSHTGDEQMRSGPPGQNHPPFSQPKQFNRNFPPNNDMMSQRNVAMNQPRYNMPMRPDMQRMRRPPYQDTNQPPMHQYPPSDFDHRNDDFQPRMAPPVSGMHGQHGMNRFERPPFDNRAGPRMDGQARPRFDTHRPSGLSMDQRMQFDQRMRAPFDQQHSRMSYDQQQLRPPFNQQHMRPQYDSHGMRPRFEQQARPEFTPHGQALSNQQPNLMPNQGPEGQFVRPGMNQPRFPSTGMERPPFQPLNMQSKNNSAKPPGNEQPPPPGVDTNLNTPQPIPSLAIPPPGTDELKPPGEESAPITPVVVEAPPLQSTSPATKSSKKKKKKHRKHKKKRAQSSSSDDDAQHAAILKQLEALQRVEEGEVAEVEDGEVQSDDEKKPSAIAAAAALLKQLKAKEKKKHKKKKKRRKETSSEEEEERRKESPTKLHPQPSDGLPPPPFFQNAVQPNDIGYDAKQVPPGMTHPLHPHLAPNEISKPLHDESSQFPPRDFRVSSYSQFPPNRYNLPPNPQGAGEPHLGGVQHPIERTEQHFTHFIGPGGDQHALGQAPDQKMGRSPLTISDDPRDMDMWNRQMRERFMDAKQHSGGKPMSDPNMKKIEKIPSLMDKFIPAPEPRRIAPITGSMRGSRHGRLHPEEDRQGRRKPDRGMRGRGRKRKRGMPPRNYHDWDQPADDGLIYYYSDSDNSSGWDSDKNFDDLLAKKKRENAPKMEQDGLAGTFSSPQPIHVTNTRRPSPGRVPAWERMEHMGEPQGIPVIGGAKPQPIPSLANRNGPPPRNEYDHMGRPLNREGESADYWMMNEQQMMMRGAPQWNKSTSSVGGGHDPSVAPWMRPGMR